MVQYHVPSEVDELSVLMATAAMADSDVADSDNIASKELQISDEAVKQTYTRNEVWMVTDEGWQMLQVYGQFVYIIAEGRLYVTRGEAGVNRGESTAEASRFKGSQEGAKNYRPC